MKRTIIFAILNIYWLALGLEACGPLPGTTQQAAPSPMEARETVTIRAAGATEPGAGKKKIKLTQTASAQKLEGLATASPLTRPGYLTAVIDPLTGAKIIRVADDAWGNICRQHYSKDQAWNADQTVIWLSKGCDKFIDAVTFAWLPNLQFPPGSGWEARWHPTDPQIMIYIRKNSLGKWNPFTGEDQTLHVFAGYKDLSIGLSEGNLSDNGQYIALFSKSKREGFVYDIVHNIQLPVIDLKGEDKVNSFTVSPLGRFVVANVNYDNVKVFGLQGNQVGKTWSEYGCPSHFDLSVDDNGDEVAVGVCKTGYKGIVKRRLLDGKITVIFPVGASHTSARNIRRPGWVYLSGLYREPYLNEIIAVKLDGTGFEILARIPNIKVSYESEMHASPSPDGTGVIAASNWNVPDGPVQGYVIEAMR